MLIEGEDSFKPGVIGAKQLMTEEVPLNERPRAIFSCNDEIATGALFAARLMNINILEHLSMEGFESPPFSRQA